MDNITDYYAHNIPSGKKVKLSNNITNTFIVLSKDRNCFLYPNPYDFTVTIDNPYYDVIEIELVRLYFNYCKTIINNDNNGFEFFFTINNEDHVFTMNMGEFDPDNPFEVRDWFNNNYTTTLQPLVKTWFDKNIGNITGSTTSSIDFILPKLIIGYNKYINRFYFYLRGKNSYTSQLMT